MSEKLNIRQKKFAEYYAQSGNAAESARKAGYSAKYSNSNVQKLLQNTAISEYIKELSEKAKDERILTAKDRQVMLSEIARNADNEPSDRIKAVDTLNKMTGGISYSLMRECITMQSCKSRLLRLILYGI